MRNKELKLLFLIFAFLSFCNHPYASTTLGNLMNKKYDETMIGDENKIGHEGGGSGGQPAVSGGGTHSPYVQGGGVATVGINTRIINKELIRLRSGMINYPSLV